MALLSRAVLRARPRWIRFAVMSSASRPGIKSAVIVALAFGAAAFAFVGPTSTVLVAMLIGGLIGIAFGNVKLSVLALTLPTVAVQACGSEVKTRQTSAPLCEPGRSEVCACPDGSESAQVCDDDGGGWGECECSTSQTDGAAGSGASTGYDAGDPRCAYLPPSACVPLQPEACNDAGICGASPAGICAPNEVAISCPNYDPPGCRVKVAPYWCCACD